MTVTKMISGEQVKSLQDLAGKNKTANAVLHSWALRDRDRAMVDFYRLKLNLGKEAGNIDDKDFLTFFQELEAQGYGSVIYGRKKKPTSFKMNYSLKSIGSAAVEGKEAPVETPKKRVILRKAVDSIPVTIKKGGTEVTVSFSDRNKLVEFIHSL